MDSVTNVLGETRPITQKWEDGSYSCPWCCSAVVAPETICQNPACFAGRWMTVEIALKARAEGEKRAQEEADRKRNHERAMQRIREDNEKRAKAYAKFAEEVKQAGGCMRCSDSYRHKIRRHRKPCPYV